MRICYRELNLLVDYDENEVNILSIENIDIYRDFLNSLYNMSEGEEGNIILSENEKSLNFSKKADLIFNPFSVDCSSKKIINGLYKELTSVISVDLTGKYSDFEKAAMELLDTAVSSLPYNLTYDEDAGIEGMLKYFDVKVDSVPENLTEKLIDYFRAMCDICSVKIFFVIGLKNYFNDTELEYIYEFCVSRKIWLISIESNFKKKLKFENNLIIDEDKCIIKA